MRDSVEHTAIRIIVDSVKEPHECAASVAASHPNGKGKMRLCGNYVRSSVFPFYKNNEQLLNGKEKTFARY